MKFDGPAERYHPGTWADRVFRTERKRRTWMCQAGHVVLVDLKACPLCGTLESKEG